MALDLLIMAAFMHGVRGGPNGKGYAEMLLRYGYGVPEAQSKTFEEEDEADGAIVVVPEDAVQRAIAELNGEI